ncbi:cation/H(+) antiporter 28 [Magnolia sinica]|uniref:cation/H(+) antiporter 28 n=1 Tax=Magnolia sinica TaxID=86752 RepID=UPI00265B4121|nr:cation/H(+) antiporter 28 [Magnolia sinica]
MEKISGNETGNSTCTPDKTTPLLVSDFALILVGGRILSAIFRFLGQPSIIAESIVGVGMGYYEVRKDRIFKHSDRESVIGKLGRLLRTSGEAGMMAYMLSVGIEMDPVSIFRWPNRAAIIAYAGILSNLIVTVTMRSIIDKSDSKLLKEGNRFDKNIVNIVMGTNTASPILTRLITELKIGKTEVGRIVVSAGIMNDMVTMLLMVILSVFDPLMRVQEDPSITNPEFIYATPIYMTLLLVAEAVFIIKVIPKLTKWVNKKNPEGRPMKPSHIFLVFLIVFVLSVMPVTVGYNAVMSAFLVGLIFPREGRLSRQMVHKINIILSLLVSPLFFCWIGLETASSLFKIWDARVNFGKVFLQFLYVAAIGTIGKVSGTVIAANLFNFQLPEAIAIGLLLNIKGHLHIYAAAVGKKEGNLSLSAFPVRYFSILFTVTYIPLVVKNIIHRARKKAANQVMTLQLHDSMTELRIMVCLHGIHNIPAAINIIEASRGGEPELSPLMIYAMDLVQLTHRTAATLTHGEGLDAVAVTDESVVKMREDITNAIEAYVQQGGEGLTVRRLLAVSLFENMHEDVCNAAADALAMLIILPFHKKQRIDGSLEATHHKFRHVNKRVLRRAPCSVGILVDRGLGGNNHLSAASATHQVAVIFIGGCDDREALAYASRLADHPGVKLTVIRFLTEAGAESSTVGTSGRILTDIQELEKEMSIDDECFANFYERNVADGRAGYVEKYVVNGAETVATLRALEGLYSLFIVGRGGKDGSALTAGMGEWVECPELGPVGDTLAASDFSVTASVLIIKQHNPTKEEEDELDDEFSVT